MSSNWDFFLYDATEGTFRPEFPVLDSRVEASWLICDAEFSRRGVSLESSDAIELLLPAAPASLSLLLYTAGSSF